MSIGHAPANKRLDMPSRAGKMKAGVRIPRHAWGVRPYRPSSSKGSTAANLSVNVVPLPSSLSTLIVP